MAHINHYPISTGVTFKGMLAIAAAHMIPRLPGALNDVRDVCGRVWKGDNIRILQMVISLVPSASILVIGSSILVENGG